MNEFFTKKITLEIIMTFVGLALIAASGGYLTSLYIVSEEQNMSITRQYEEKVEALAEIERQKINLAKKLDVERITSSSLVGQVGHLSNTVDVLQKYAKTDKQLLEKYSKVYFLNENYSPESLRDIDPVYLLDKDKSAQFLTKAHSFLEKLMIASKASNLDLFVASAYRSFGTQTTLKSSYKRIFGTTAANSFSADQGYSEHQLGTAVDFTTTAIGGKLEGFDKTKEFQWLKDFAYQYGFILSYPVSNKYYIFEPWHWRFVGLRLALRLHNENKNFYDMDQREINEYLVEMFDPS